MSFANDAVGLCSWTWGIRGVDRFLCFLCCETGREECCSLNAFKVADWA